MKQLFRVGNQPDLTAAVQSHYAAVAARAERAGQRGETSAGCCSSSAGYDAAQLNDLTPETAAASAGCGNPVALADIRSGETVLDLGSGGGIDCFLAAQAAGPAGRVIGVDMTPAMVALARKNAATMGVRNVAFKLARIEAIPEPDATVDMVMSNCVINLSERKDLVFAEIFRVLKPGGRMIVSDIVVEGQLPAEVQADPAQWAVCVAGAEEKRRYLALIEAAGLGRAEVLKDEASVSSGGGGWQSRLRSVTVRAFKPG
jgi:SAM-dependent methyltransferase